MKTRRILYTKGVLKSKGIEARVISVGNITVGGTGKTPIVEMIARELLQNGAKPAVVSRGYKGCAKGKLTVVSDGKEIISGPALSGDEPYMLAEHLPGVPVITCKSRYDAARHAVKCNADIIILDDGFQHMKLKRDLNILLIDKEILFGRGTIFPHGILREPICSIKQADAIIFTKSQDKDITDKNRLGSLIGDTPVFWSHLSPTGCIELTSKKIIQNTWLKEKKILAFCGIGTPASFKKIFTRLGAKVVYFAEYSDHYQYTRKDLASLIKKAADLEAKAIVTTQKDGVRIQQYLPLSWPIWAMKIKMEIIDDKERWKKLLME